MKREERRHHRTAPARASHAAQEPEKDQNIRNVEERVDEEMAAGIESENLTVDHVRQPRKRVPVTGVEGGERPDDSPPAQAGRDHRVVANVKVIIEIDELVPEDLRING